jgi:uncharacterized hydrophobic protein (TIGR00271 family)
MGVESTTGRIGMKTSTPNSAQQTVRFSRTLRLWIAVAVGASTSVGLGVFSIFAVFPQQVANINGLVPAFLLLAVIAISFTLTLAERGTVLSASGGAYGLARHSGQVWQSYFTGWVLLAGYTVVVSLLAWSTALHLSLLARLLFGAPLDFSLLAVVVIGGLSLNMLIERYWAWVTRSRLIIASIVFLFVVIIAEIFNQPTVEALPAITFSTRDMFELTALLVVSLWGLFSILAVRNEIHRPTKTIPRAMMFSVLLVTGLGILLSWLIGVMGISFLSGILQATDISEINFSFVGDISILIYALSGAVITILALNHALASNNNLFGTMTRDGSFPRVLQRVGKHYNTPVLSLIPLALFSIMLVTLVPVDQLVPLASLAFLWAIALIHFSDAVRPTPMLPQNRHPKLPFHPLFPWLTISIGLLISFALPFRSIIVGLLWIAVGGLYYAGYARRHGLSIRSQEIIVGQEEARSLEEMAAYRILVGVNNPRNAVSLLQAGIRLANARQGVLLVLKVLTVAEHIPVSIRQQKAQQELEALFHHFAEAGLERTDIKPIIRLASSVSDGILETVAQEKIDLLLLGWKDETYLKASYERPILNRVIGLAPCEVAILKGNLPVTVSRVLVPTAGGPHAPTAVKLGQHLAFDPNVETPHIELIHFTETMTGLQDESDSGAALQDTLNATRNGNNIDARVVETTTIKAGILTEAEQSDVLIMGASHEDVLRRSFLGELPSEVTGEVTVPTIITKTRETESRPGWLRIWWLFNDLFPQLSVTRQAEVYASMRVSAIPSVDFFVLITLAATIAMLGLLQNSAAVIIGAMLVAPLMSPILAMGMSIVHGDLKTLATATEATLKGIVLAIGVGVLFTVISPLKAPTNEILARTSPNLLDLLVALASGAAAGYAISRKEVAAALPGVAIAAALVPPLCVVGYGIGTSQLGTAGGAMLLFTTNLVAIIFAAAIVFLLLGFHPTRRERGELVRGLRVTLISLGVITLVLAGSTYATVTELNRRLRVESVFNQAVIKRSAQVVELNITRNRSTYIIDATILNYPENELTPKQLQELEADLVDAVGGPVEVKIASIDASIGELKGADSNQQLENLFKGKMVEYGATTQDVAVQQEDGKFTITAIVISYPGALVTRSDMIDIQESLSETMAASVLIRATILAGQQVNLQAVSPIATPTSEP